MKTILPPKFRDRAARIMADVRNSICIDDADAEVLAEVLKDALNEYYDELEEYYAEEYYIAISSARSKAYDDGHSDGYADGYDVGYEDGYSASLLAPEAQEVQSGTSAATPAPGCKADSLHLQHH